MILGHFIFGVVCAILGMVSVYKYLQMEDIKWYTIAIYLSLGAIHLYIAAIKSGF